MVFLRDHGPTTEQPRTTLLLVFQANMLLYIHAILYSLTPLEYIDILNGGQDDERSGWNLEETVDGWKCIQ